MVRGHQYYYKARPTPQSMDDNIMLKVIPANDQDACFICGATNVTLRQEFEYCTTDKEWYSEQGGARCPTCWYRYLEWLEEGLAAERRMRNLEFSRGA